MVNNDSGQEPAQTQNIHRSLFGKVPFNEKGERTGEHNECFDLDDTDCMVTKFAGMKMYH